VTPPDDLTADELLAIAARYHPTGAFDVDPGYTDLREVQARRAVQRVAEGAADWRDLLNEIGGLWPSAKVMDYSKLDLDCGRHVRVMRDPADPGHHLVAWLSLLAPVALVYESRQPCGQRAVVTPPHHARDAEGIQQLRRLIHARGRQVLPWDIATQRVPLVAVGNLLPGEATLASCLFSDNLW
jgi:hypothetical protein